MSIDENFELQPPKFFDDVLDGAEELRRFLEIAPGNDSRAHLADLIRQLETGEVRAALFVATYPDRSVQPIIIGGDVHERLAMVERLKTQLEEHSKKHFH